MRYKLLGPSGLRVSEICLGTMSFGEKWGFGANEKDSHRVLDIYAEAGGNFLDTANIYHNGHTEEILGSWLRNNRDRMVVASKFALATDHNDPNSAGSHRRNLRRSIDNSLRRMNIEAIDLLWVHVYDDQTPLEETLDALNDSVRSGKVHYIGISDTPAWAVSAMQTRANLLGLCPLVALQIEYSLLERTAERDLLPMAEHFGLAVTAWGPMAGGVLSGKYTRNQDNDSLRKQANDGANRTSEEALNIAKRVDKVADDLGVSSAQVALAWVLQQGYRFIPIVGARKESQIVDSLKAAELPSFADEHRQALEDASKVELGFPHAFLRQDYVADMRYTEKRQLISLRPKKH